MKGICIGIICGIFCKSLYAFANWEVGTKGYIEFLHGVAQKQVEHSLADNINLHGELSLTNGNHRFFTAIDTGYYRYVPEQWINIKEAYWMWMGDNADLTIGRQIIPWGKADGITITDRLSPKSRYQLIDVDYQDSRLGVDGVKLRYLNDQSTSEFIWIPLPRFDALPYNPNNPLSKVYHPQQIILHGKNVDLIYPTAHKPNKLKDSEWALRQSFYTSFMDLSFSFFRGWDRELVRTPEISFHNIMVMQPQSHRITQYGADLAFPEGDRVWRGEVAYLPNRLFIDKKGKATEYKQWLALLGVDWQFDSATMTAQYVTDKVNKANTLVRDKYQSMLTINIDKNFLRDKLILSTGAYFDLNRSSSALMFKIDYAFSDNLNISSGINHFESGGQSNSTFAPMQPFSSIWGKIRYSF